MDDKELILLGGFPGIAEEQLAERLEQRVAVLEKAKEQGMKIVTVDAVNVAIGSYYGECHLSVWNRESDKTIFIGFQFSQDIATAYAAELLGTSIVIDDNENFVEEVPYSSNDSVMALQELIHNTVPA